MHYSWRERPKTSCSADGLPYKRPGPRHYPPTSSPIRQAIEAAIVVDDFVHYRSMYDYSRNVTAAIRSIEEILEGGLASEVIDLCEYTLECVEDAYRTRR